MLQSRAGLETARPRAAALETARPLGPRRREGAPSPMGK